VFALTKISGLLGFYCKLTLTHLSTNTGDLLPMIVTSYCFLLKQLFDDDMLLFNCSYYARSLSNFYVKSTNDILTGSLDLTLITWIVLVKTC
jgi:hypothetical protein